MIAGLVIGLLVGAAVGYAIGWMGTRRVNLAAFRAATKAKRLHDATLANLKESEAKLIHASELLAVVRGELL